MTPMKMVLTFLKNVLEWCKEHHDKAHLCVLGDLNARTGNYDDFILDDSATYLPIEDWYLPDLFNVKRMSQDVNMNAFGTKLLDVFKIYCMHICNGRKNDQSGHFTYISHNGSSVVDYCIAQTELYDCISQFSVHSEDFGSDHLPCIINIDVQIGLHNATNMTAILQPRVRYKWEESKVNTYLEHLVNTSVSKLPSFEANVCNHNVYGAVEIITSIITEAGECMRCIPSNKSRKRNEWWDRDCDTAKKENT